MKWLKIMFTVPLWLVAATSATSTICGLVTGFYTGRDSGIETGRALGRAETQSLANNFTVSVAWKELNAMLVRQAKTGWQIRLEGENGKPVILNVMKITDDSGRYPKR